MTEQCRCAVEIEMWYADSPGYWHLKECVLFRPWNEHSLENAIKDNARTSQLERRLAAAEARARLFDEVIDSLVIQFAIKETRRPLRPVQRSLVHSGDFDSVSYPSLCIAVISWLDKAYAARERAIVL